MKQQVTWIFVILGNIYDVTRGEWRSDAHVLLSSQELWFAFSMTVLYASTQCPVLFFFLSLAFSPADPLVH
jgi:hypothetical protein